MRDGAGIMVGWIVVAISLFVFIPIFVHSFMFLWDWWAGVFN